MQFVQLIHTSEIIAHASEAEELQEVPAEEQEELEVGILIDAPAVYGMIRNIILLKI